jgi:hypothetical protein
MIGLKIESLSQFTANNRLKRTWQARHEIPVGDIFNLPSSTKLRLLLAKPLSRIVSVEDRQKLVDKKEISWCNKKMASQRIQKYCEVTKDGIAVNS